MAWKYIRDQQGVEDLLPILMARNFWGIDCETTGLDYFTDKVTLLQLGDFDNQYIIDTRYVSIEALRPFFDNERCAKIGHNLKFDYKMLKTNFGISMERPRDTFLADKVLNNGKKFKGFGLDDNLEALLGVKIDKTLQKSFIGHQGPFSDAQLEYAANDIKYLILLADKQKGLLRKDGLLDTWSLECNCIPCFGDMEVHGLLLDKERWSQIAKSNVSKAQELAMKMTTFITPYCNQNVFGEAEFNFGSPTQIVPLLNKMGAKVREWDQRTEQWVLLPVVDSKDSTLCKIVNCPITEMIQDYRSHMVLASTFGQPYIAAVHPKTGRIHPDFHQIGTETGRPAAGTGGVNLLNIPREKAMRNCFHAPEDYVIETDDFSGCELRIWAHLSQDPQLCEALRTGKDLHRYVAGKLYGKPCTKTENPELRTPAKSLNFGIAYGMGPKKLFEQLNGQGFSIEFEQARFLFDKYCKEFKTGVDFLRNSGKKALTQGYLANANGRRRNWNIPDPKDTEKFPQGRLDPKFKGITSGIEREGGNFMIQSVNADLTKYAMICMRKHIKKNKIRSNIILQVYDEVVTCTHKDDSEAFHAAKVDIMVKAAQTWIHSVPIEVEGNVLPYWTK